MSFTLRVNDIRIMPGCSAGLAEPSALISIAHTGAPDEGFSGRVSTGVGALFAEPGFWSVPSADSPGSGGAPAGRSVGEWVANVAVALQQQAGDPVWQGRVLHSESCRTTIAVGWRRREVVEAAVDFAVRIIQHWAPKTLDEKRFRALVEHLREGLEGSRAEGLDPALMRFARAAHERGVPVAVLASGAQFGWGAAARRVRDGLDDRADVIGVLAATDISVAHLLMANAALPFPDGDIVANVDAALGVAERIGWPVVVKPRSGRGPTMAGIADAAALAAAAEYCGSTTGQQLVVERHVDGDEHRLLIVDGRLIAAVRYAPDDGTIDDVLGLVHPHNRMLAERVARTIGLETLGVQLLITDISRSWRDVGGAVCGLEPRPVLGGDWTARWPHDVTPVIADLAFDTGSGRIPTAAITGTDAALVAELVHHFWTHAGRTAGMSAAGVLRIGNCQVIVGGQDDPGSGRILLTDPAVDAAIFQLDGAEVEALGHPCDRYDVAAAVGVDCLTAGQQEILERACHVIVLEAERPDLPDLLARFGALRRIVVSAGPTAHAEVVLAEEIEGRRWIVHRCGHAATPLFVAEAVPAGCERRASVAAAVALAQGLDATIVGPALGTFGWTGPVEGRSP